MLYLVYQCILFEGSSKELIPSKSKDTERFWLVNAQSMQGAKDIVKPLITEDETSQLRDDTCLIVEAVQSFPHEIITV